MQAPANANLAPPGDYMLFLLNSDGVPSVGKLVRIAAPADTTGPTVTVTAPTAGSTVTNIISVSATAGDDTGVVGVQFKLDGANLEAEDVVGPVLRFVGHASGRQRLAHPHGSCARRRRQRDHVGARRR